MKYKKNKCIDLDIIYLFVLFIRLYICVIWDFDISYLFVCLYDLGFEYYLFVCTFV